MSSPENSSLWLVPPSDSALNKTISKLINETLPPLFPEALPPQFVPHLTLTASTIPTPSAPEDWLLQLQLLLPDLSNLAIEVGELHVGDIYFQKLIQLCDKTPELCQLATKCRVFGTGDHIVETKKWVEGNYKPHVSLVYSDLSPEEMTSKLDRIKDEICKAKEAAGKKLPCAKTKAATIITVECSLILESYLANPITLEVLLMPWSI